MSLWNRTLLSIVFLSLAGQRAVAQSRPDTLSGRVVADSTTPVAGATVTITRAPDRLVQRTVTDASGGWSQIFTEGTGDYLVHTTADGYNSARKRVQRSAEGTLPSIVLTIRLLSAAQEIAPVKVVAGRPRPSRESFTPSIAGGVETMSGGIDGTIPPGVAGDLAANIALTPGVVSTPTGMSILGAAGSDGSVTLGGMGFSGGSVPRDARTLVTISTTSYDPSVGWFSGFRTNVELEEGNLFSRRSVSTTLDAPFLQLPSASGIESRFSNVRVSAGGDGMFWGDRTSYSYGAEAAQRSAPFLSVQTASPENLLLAGIAPDSAARFLGLAIPGISRASLGGIDNATTRKVSLIGRLDRAPVDMKTLTARTTVVAVTGNVDLTDARGAGGGSLLSAERASQSRNVVAGIQGIYSKYITRNFLHDLRSSISTRQTDLTAASAIPSGTVRVISNTETGGLSSIEFGGNPFEQSSRNFLWETISRSAFYFDRASKHSGALTIDARYDGFEVTPQPNTKGSFFYNSLADLEQNVPSSYSRVFNPLKQAGGEWNGFVSLADKFKLTKDVQVVLGARAERNHFTYAPVNNPLIEQVFGVRNNFVPNTAHLSPRVGFTWIKRGGFGVMRNELGGFRLSPEGFLRGGFGEFRGMTSPTLLAGPAAYTGLPGSTRQISCIGTATPAADWAGLINGSAAAPSECVGGAGPSAFRDASPSVQLIDPAYAPPRSWRANLGYGSIFRGFAYSVDGVYSLNIDQPGRVDLNFANLQRFSTGDEQRPVFVNPADIVARTGQVSASGGRISNQFGSVMQTSSDLRSQGVQVVMSLRTPRPFPVMTILSYTLAGVRSRESGFTGSTFWSPLQKEWGRSGSDVRHQIMVQAGRMLMTPVFRGLKVTGSATIQSGVPFTPIVGTDVNGDGFRNDRAFVLPGASSMECVRAQLGSVVRRNSCDGPWSVIMNAQLSKNIKLSKYGPTGQVSLAIANPLGGLDQVLHGADRLRGWGSVRYADNVLYSVNGFDPVARKFTYAVNPAFGAPRRGYSALAAPFRVTLDVTLDVGMSRAEQQIIRWFMPGRGRPGEKLESDELRKRYARNVTNPYRSILWLTDSLLLSRDQVDRLQQADTLYRAQMDSLWTQMVSELVALPDNFKSRVAMDIQETWIDRAWELTRLSVKKNLREILNPLQLTMLPSLVQWMYDSDKPIHVRMFSY